MRLKKRKCRKNVEKREKENKKISNNREKKKR